MYRYLYTEDQFRLTFIKSQAGFPLNWLFLPGGPGLGSESLKDLTAQLDVAGTIWHVDYPGDGSNRHVKNCDYNQWAQGLENLVCSLDHVVIVAHSFGGMLTLTNPALEKHLAGIVLLCTAPNHHWIREMAKHIKLFQLPDISDSKKKYLRQPSDELLKQITLASVEYSFTKKSLEQGRELLTQVPYNHKTYDWAAQNFHAHYQAKWIPTKIPALIIGGELDHLTPLKLFSDDERFKQNNILIESIKNAGHFPWYDDMDRIKMIFLRYQDTLLMSQKT